MHYLIFDTGTLQGFRALYKAKNWYCYANKINCKILTTPKEIIPETIHCGFLSGEIINATIKKTK